MFKRLLLTYTTAKGYHVDLPNYAMIEGTFSPVLIDMVHPDGVLPGVDPRDVINAEVSVLVQFPNDAYKFKGDQIDPIDLRKRYIHHERFGSKQYKPPKVIGDK